MKLSKSRIKFGTTLAVLISAQFVIMLDTSVVNVALPSMQRDLNLTPTGIAWVVNAYFLAFGGFLLVSGRAADLFGGRRMFMTGAALFTLTTLLAGFSPNESVLIGARVLQGLGAAILSPAALSIVLAEFPGAGRARAMGAWGAASAAGGAIGVAAGGAITGALGWSWVFFLTVPITMLAFVAAPFLFSGQIAQKKKRPFDVKGASAITGGALAAIYAILSGAERGWLSLEVISGAGITVGLIVYFVHCERRAADPIVPLALFRDRSVAAGVLIGFLGGAVRVSTFVLSALYLQQVLKASPAVAGLAMVPTSVAGFLVSLVLLPRIIRALGPERTLTLGLLLLAAGHLWLSRVPSDVSYSVDVLPGLLVASAGVALSFTPSTMVIASGIPSAQSGLASGLATASSQIGAAVGVAAFSAVMAAGRQNNSIEHGFQCAFGAAGMLALAAAFIAVLFLRSTRKHLGTTLERSEPGAPAAAVGAPKRQ
ncbi:MFS transporter [Arthrobacter sp. RHLT1-20]